MDTKLKVKVIKKGTPVKINLKTEDKNPQKSAREVVSNVTNWVTDFQKRKRVETKQAIELLFANQPQTNGI